MYQRQISKQGLSGAVMDLKASDFQFSQEDLKVPVTVDKLKLTAVVKSCAGMPRLLSMPRLQLLCFVRVVKI